MMKNLKIKKLKEIEILGYVFKIDWDKARYGGAFDFANQTLTIGTKDFPKYPENVFQVLMHELSEAIHVVLNTRYDDCSVSGNYKFFLDHKEFETHNVILSNIILKFL